MKAIRCSLLVSTSILVSCSVASFAQNEWSAADKVFVVLEFKSEKPDLGHQLADSIQLRLRSKIDRNHQNAYVLSWAELEASVKEREASPETLDAFIKDLGLSDHQELYVVAGELSDGPGNAFAAKAHYFGKRSKPEELAVKGSFSLKYTGQRWKPELAREIADYVYDGVYGKSDLKTDDLFPASQPAKKWGPSILPNGSFEQGQGFKPHKWDTVDNLCSFWVKDGPGRVLRFETNVQQEQASEWARAVKNGASPANAPTPIRTEPPHYDSVGGNEGAKLYSDFVSVRPGKTFRLSVRAKGPVGGQVKIFVKAYALLPGVRTDKLVAREVWQTYLHCVTTGDWKDYQQEFTLPAKLLPIEKKDAQGNIKAYAAEIRWLRVMPFAYWVVGTYDIDDIKIQPRLP